MKDIVAITVEHVSKSFKLPHNKQNSIKGTLVNFFGGDRTYETQDVLKDVSFDIKEGEFFGIVGRNGSGKSTLLKMLAGIYEPTNGTVKVHGSLTPFIELGVGFNPELTGRENVYLNGALLGFNNADVDEMYDDIVQFAELERFMDQKLKNYSSGMQVRLAFSIAIRARSDILLIDEVLAVGDAAFQQKCFDYFEELKRDKRTIIFVSHDMHSVQRFCTRAMMLEKGAIKIIGKPYEVAAAYQEDNLVNAGPAMGKPKRAVSEQSEIEVTVSKNDETHQQAEITIRYTQAEKQDVYVGFSIIKDGFTIAEMNNAHDSSSRTTRSVKYTLDTSNFNPGAYEVSAALIKTDTKAPLAQCQTRPKFIIKGYDMRRGGGMWLEDNWTS